MYPSLFLIDKSLHLREIYIIIIIIIKALQKPLIYKKNVCVLVTDLGGPTLKKIANSYHGL